MSAERAPAIPAATVVLLRDGDDGIETLLLRRNSKLAFGGGAWVFPGGRVDAEDGDRTGAPTGPGVEAAARRAGVREIAEEAGMVVAPEALVPFSHWTPPGSHARRFATWFFLAEAPRTTVEVDGWEIVDHLWIRPSDALARHAASEVELMPPTWVTLDTVGRHADVASALAEAASQPLQLYEARFVTVDGAILFLYGGDAGYDDLDVDREGPRHRLMTGDPKAWHYERDFSGET